MNYTNYTDLFSRFREIARIIWNVGFWPYPSDEDQVDLLEVFKTAPNVPADLMKKLRFVGDLSEAYDDIVARLFDAIVLLTVGVVAKSHPGSPGDAARFLVAKRSQGTWAITIEASPPNPKARSFKNRVLEESDQYRFRFLDFFDWRQFDIRDFEFVEVVVESLDSDPSCVGRRAMIPFQSCVFLREEEARNEETEDS